MAVTKVEEFALQAQVQTLTSELEQAQRDVKKLKTEAIHNKILSALINKHFRLSKINQTCCQQQVEFLQAFSGLCETTCVCVYKLAVESGCFVLENYFACDETEPQRSFISANAPIYISNLLDPYCNFIISPMRFACGANDLHWFYNKSSRRAILVSNKRQVERGEAFDCLSAAVLSTTLQLYEDIEVKHIYEDRLIHQATIDSTTALPNRHLAFDRLSQAIINRANASKIVFAMVVDIARFKDINETFGHDIGDKILALLAQRIRCAVREGDTVARLGGDEFLIGLENANKLKAAEVVANKVIDAISAPLQFEGRELLVSSNIGIAAYPDDGNDASVLIQNADAAMCQSRKMGVNRFQFYTPAMNEEIANRLILETALQKAQNNNEFSLHYQPLIECSSGRVVAVEALLRWQSSSLGNVSPERFIPIAEEDGFIVAIGYWIIDQVCQQLISWQKDGIANLTVAINISVRQLQDPSFVDNIMAILGSYGISSSKIELEITEGIMISDDHGVDGVLGMLHTLGFKLSLDDFGTGYSALSYLNKYHFDYLKIDRSFVTRMTKSEKDRALVNAIVAMAHKLNLKVIAEGVESSFEADYLKSQKCDYLQGFYFSMPISAANIRTTFFSNQEETT